MTPERQQVLDILGPAVQKIQQLWLVEQNPKAFAPYWVLSALFVGMVKVQDTKIATMGRRAHRFIKEMQAGQN